MFKKIIFCLAIFYTSLSMAQVLPPTSLPPVPGSLPPMPDLPKMATPSSIYIESKPAISPVKKQAPILKKDEDFVFTSDARNDLLLFKPKKYYTNGKLNKEGLEVRANSAALVLSKEFSPALQECQKRVILLVRELMATPGIFSWAYYQHPNYGPYLRTNLKTQSFFNGNEEFEIACAVSSNADGLWLMDKSRFSNGLLSVKVF